MIVVKVGGSILDSSSLKTICADVRLLHTRGEDILIVHGGGRKIKTYEQLLQTPSTYVGRWRVTTEETLRVLKIVALETTLDILTLLEGLGVGVCGPSANAVIAEEKEYEENQWVGFVGRPKTINTSFLHTLLSQRFIPVISFIAKGTKYPFLNVNADELAAAVAISMNASHVVFLTDVDGILCDGKPLSVADESTLSSLHLCGGISFKAESALSTARAGIRTVVANGSKDRPLQRALAGEGTLIKAGGSSVGRDTK